MCIYYCLLHQKFSITLFQHKFSSNFISFCLFKENALRRRLFFNFMNPLLRTSKTFHQFHCKHCLISDEYENNSLFRSTKMRHAKFLARTVLVQNNNVEEAARLLNRILGKEEILDQFRRTRFYEKPFQVKL